MKKCITLGAVLSMVGLLSGCATNMPVGSFYTDLKLPVNATTNQGKKIGTAECKSIMALFATGDCSIESAKKNGQISKVATIDWEAKSILGIYGTYKLIVSGD